MASPGSVVIQFLVEAGTAVRDAAGFARALDEVETEAAGLDSTLGTAEAAIREVGSAADVAETDLDGLDFDALALEAQQAATKIRTAADDMGDGVRSGAADMDTATDGIKGSLGEAGSEAGAEFIGNIAEGIGSGQANIADVAQGTLGGLTNLAATLGGPIGLAAGAAAAGIGLVFASIKGESEKAKAKIDELRDALSDVGDLGSQVARKKIFDAWIEKSRETTGRLEAVNTVLKEAHISTDLFMDALAGDPAAVERVTTQIAIQRTHVGDMATKGQQITEDQRTLWENAKLVNDEINGSDQAMGALRREQDAVNELTSKARTRTDEWNDELGHTESKTENIKDDITEATRDRNVVINFKADVSKLPRHLGGNVDITAASAPTAATTASPTPATVTAPPARVAEEQIYRAVHRLLIRGDTRNGRALLAVP